MSAQARLFDADGPAERASAVVAEAVGARPLGGGAWLVGSLAAGVVGLGLTGVGFVLAPTRTLYAYLTAFAYVAGIALGALGWLCSFHAARARWPVVVRRLFEAVASSLPALALLFVPIAAFAPRVFPWARPLGELASPVREHVEHARAYLQVPFFLARAALFFALWIAIAETMRRWSLRQDATGGVALTGRQRALGPAALPALGLSMSFAAFDWLMSLSPGWASTMFGLYYISGAVVGAIALLTLLAAIADRRGPLAGLLTPSHHHALGKLLFAFVCFWAYIAFSQFMLIWIANLPEEIPWYLARMGSGWGGVAVLLVVGHFVVPFFVLLPRAAKRSPIALAVVSVWVLAMHYVDLYWVVVPRIAPGAPMPHFTDVTALVGVGGMAAALGLWRQRGRSLLPVGDPYLADSLRYDR